MGRQPSTPGQAHPTAIGTPIDLARLIDQFIRIEAGTGVVRLNGEERALEDGSAVVIPAGVEHNVVNTSKTAPLRLYTLYSPPEHPDGTVHHRKEEATAGAHH